MTRRRRRSRPSESAQSIHPQRIPALGDAGAVLRLNVVNVVRAGFVACGSGLPEPLPTDAGGNIAPLSNARGLAQVEACCLAERFRQAHGGFGPGARRVGEEVRGERAFVVIGESERVAKGDDFGDEGYKEPPYLGWEEPRHYSGLVQRGECLAVARHDHKLLPFA